MATTIRVGMADHFSLRRAYLRFCDWSYGRARAWLLPDLRNSQFAYLAALRRALTGSGRWLDLGCGHGFLPDWLEERDRRLDLSRWRAVGVDLDDHALKRHPDLSLRVHADVERLPFSSGTFSLITANMVLEHVRDPGNLFSEISRVLAPGGTLLVHTPNKSGYTTLLARLIPASLVATAAGLLLGRKSEDVYPAYYRANSSAELTRLCGPNLLNPTTIEHVVSSPQLIRIPPLMLLEVLWLRLLENTRRAALRPCIVACFQRQDRLA